MYAYEKIVYFDGHGQPAGTSLMRMPKGGQIVDVEKYDFAEGCWKNNEEWGTPRPDIIDEWHNVIELEEGLCDHCSVSEEEAERIIGA